MGGRGAAAEGGREPAAAITPWPHHGTLKSPDRYGGTEVPPRNGRGRTSKAAVRRPLGQYEIVNIHALECFKPNGNHRAHR